MCGWLKKIFSPLKERSERNSIWLYIECQKCGNRLKMCIHPETDLIRGYSKDEAPYTLHKETLDNKCFNPIIIDIQYDKELKELSKKIEGGRFMNGGR